MTQDQQPGFWADVGRAIIGSALFASALWGALGGATNALVIRTTAREAIRHIALGALFSSGAGGLSAPIIAHWLDLPTDAISAAGIGAGGAPLAYITGAVGPALLEALALRRKKRGDTDVQDP